MIPCCCLAYRLTSIPHSSGKAGLDDPRLSELYDLSKAARDMRAQLASSLQQAQSAQIRHKYGSLKESMRNSRFLVSPVRSLFNGILLMHVA